MEIFISIIGVIFWSFLICFNAVSYLFAIHVFLDRKDIRFGFSELKPNLLDFIVVYTIPVILSVLLFVLYYEFNFPPSLN